MLKLTFGIWAVVLNNDPINQAGVIEAKMGRAEASGTARRYHLWNHLIFCRSTAGGRGSAKLLSLRCFLGRLYLAPGVGSAFEQSILSR